MPYRARIDPIWINHELEDIESKVLQLLKDKPNWGGLILDTLRGTVRDHLWFFKKKYIVKYYTDSPCAYLITFRRYITDNLMQQIDFDQANLTE